MNPDGSGATNLTSNPADDYAPKWSPNGSRIAFTSDRHGNDEIYTMAADGSDVRRITDNPAADSSPAWSPDGAKIVFMSNRSPGCGIYVMGADGSSVTRLTSLDSSCVYLGAPVWSPDGAEIAFFDLRFFRMGDDGDLVPFYDVSKINPDGSGRYFLSEGGTAPDWSPDSARLAFFGWDDAKLYLMNRDGSGRTDLGYGLDTPAWSPDGRRIVAYRFNCCVETPGLMTLDPDGGARVKITEAPDYDPDWQPIPGPNRDDYKNAAKFCDADRAFLGDSAFTEKYGTNGNGSNAHGKCMGVNR